MILQEISLKGFSSYKDLTTIQIPLGLTGIIGSYASNSIKSVGAGKTTIVAALNYAFFGKGEFDKIEELINDQLGPKDNFFVRVKFKKGNSLFEVERGRNPDSYLELKENNISRGDPKIDKRTEEIQKIIGMDYSMFTASVFFEQDRLNKLVDTDPATRRGYIEKVLGTALWTQGEKLINRDKNNLKKDIESIQKELSSIEEKIKENKQSLETLSEVQNSLEENFKKKNDLTSKLLPLVRIKEQKERLYILFDERNVFKDKKEEYQKKLSSLNISISLNITESKELDKKVIEIQDNISSSQKEESSYKLKLAEQEQKYLELSEEILQVNSKAIKALAEKDSYQRSKEQIIEGLCPTCTQEITKDFLLDKHKQLDIIIEDLDKVLKKNNTLNFNLLREKGELKKEIDTNKQILENISSTKSDLNTELNELDKKKSNILTFLQSVDTIKKEYEKIIIQSEASELEKLGLINEIQWILPDNFDESKLFLLEEELKKTELGINLLNQDLGKLQHINENLKDNLLEKEEKEKQIKDKEYNLSIQKILEEEFTKIPSNILTTSVYHIEKEAGDIIHSFEPTMDINVREDLTKVSKPLQVFFTVDGKRRNYKRLSGGQRTIANLALRLGFSKVIASRVGIQLKFLILDEPFAFLDNHNREIVKKILMELKKSFSQIIVISHVDNIQDFPNLIKVTMGEDGISRIN